MLLAAPAHAGKALIAVAANFSMPAERIAAEFEAATGHEITLTAGSTGKLYAQIAAGAPYDVLLAADAERPARLEAEGLAVAGSRFTYAVGQLVLWSADPARITGPEALDGAFRALAIANPELAPYGIAAVETLASLGKTPARIVMGENIGQTFALVSTGNAELGFVAASQLTESSEGSRWDVPASLHAPIRQEAVLLTRAASNEAAHAFLDWLRRPEAAVIIAASGYGSE